MPNIINTTFFTGDLFIPLAANNITTVPTMQTPNNNTVLEALITEYEKLLLVNALGLTAYNELQTALADLPNADHKWQDLVNGVEYDGKIWDGLGNAKSVIAYYVYCQYVEKNPDFLTAMGTAKPNSENAILVNPTQRLVNFWEVFLNKYQRNIYFGYGYDPVMFYKSTTDVNQSLYQFLNDKKDDYTFDNSKFKFYQHKNSFGL